MNTSGPTQLLPSRLTKIEGYVPYSERSDYRSTQAFIQRVKKVLIILFAATILFIWLFVVPMREKWSTENLLLLVLWTPCYALYRAIVYFPKRRLTSIANTHVSDMRSLVVKTICAKIDPAGQWRWLPLQNSGSAVFFVPNMVGILNDDRDSILYVPSSAIAECKIESRHVGSTTNTQGQAMTAGYAGGVLGAFTSASAKETTQQHYSHVVDLYTRTVGHLPLYFGENETNAKEVYGRLVAMRG
jgi:hypothetical protein